MKLKKLKKIIDEGKIIVINSSNKKLQQYNKYILRKDSGEYIIECFKNNILTYKNSLIKETYKSVKKFIKQNLYKTLDNKRIIKNSPEKKMKLDLLPYLKTNYPNGSIVSEFSHFKLKSRPDIMVFENGESYLFELKSEKDNLSKILEQIEEYRKISHNIFIVINQKHLKEFLSLNILDVTLIVEYDKKIFEIYYTGYNEKTVDISFLIWTKELKSLYSGLKKEEKNKVFLNNNIRLYNLTNLILEERFKENTKDIYKKDKNLFNKREFNPVNKKLDYFLKKINLK